jgi:hypothetical protein
VFVAVGIQHATRMRHIVVCVLPGCAYLTTLPHKRHEFRRTVIVYKMCVMIFYATLVWTISHFKKNGERDMIKNVHWSSCTVRVILARLEWKLNFLYRFSKNTQISSFIKMRVVLCGRTNRHDEASSRFSQFVNAPKNDHMFWPCFLIIIGSYNTYITVMVRVTRSRLL